MSRASAMTIRRRIAGYLWQNLDGGAVKERRGDRLTPRQFRRAVRKSFAAHSRLIREGGAR